MTTTHKSLSSHPRGDVIYRHGRPARFNFSGGYVDLDGTSPRFHYYTLDYLGSVRATVDGSTGALEQTIAYYPFGGIIADLGLNRTLRPYKFLGKELDQTHGLNQYDFGARQYFPALTIFTQPDPLSEKTPWLSPYLYCGGNPVNLVDRDGLEPLPPTIDEIIFIQKHPICAFNIGTTQSENYPIIGYFSDNISARAHRIAYSYKEMDKNWKEDMGSAKGALRHALWQAKITVQYGTDIAKMVGDAHEVNPSVDLSNRNFSSLEEADQTADLLNNMIGRHIGISSNSKGMMDLAFEVLNMFKDKGLFTITKDEKGNYSVVKTKISEETYQKIFELFLTLDENGKKIDPPPIIL